MRQFFVGLFAVTALPVWMLPIALVPGFGFKIYLTVSSIYYSIAGLFLGPRWVVNREFGAMPDGAAGYFFVFLFYGFVYALGYLLVKRLMAKQ